MSRFPAAHFCLLAMRRHEDGSVRHEYLSTVLEKRYDFLVLVDCISSTGNTLRASLDVMRGAARFDRAMGLVIACSTLTAAFAEREGMSLIGHSLRERDASGVLVPDFGMDAGDVFTGQVIRT